MSFKDILERFALISGLSEQETARFLPVIEDCRVWFEERLRDGLSESELRRAAYACAVYAYYKISRIAQNDRVSSFKVGDVQMTPLPRAETVERLWLEERENICDIIDVGAEFGFKGVAI